MFITDPVSEFFPSRIRIFSIPDPGQKGTGYWIPDADPQYWLLCVPDNNRIYISQGGEQRDGDGERDEGTEKRRQGSEGTEEQREQLASRFRSSPAAYLLPGKSSSVFG
jgi:hypothetical protein